MAIYLQQPRKSGRFSAVILLLMDARRSEQREKGVVVKTGTWMTIFPISAYEKNGFRSGVWSILGISP